MSALLSVRPSVADRRHHITLTPGALAGCLGGIAFLLLIGHFAVQIVKFTTGHDTIYGLIPLFELDQERNVPATFSTLNLFGASLLLGVIARFQWHAGSPDRWAWMTLALGFLWLAFDEAVCLHELLARPTAELLGQRSEPLIHLSWVVPALPLVVLLGLMFIPFLRRLTAKHRRRFVMAGMLYVGGALGMEVVDVLWLEIWGARDLTYQLLVAVEEGLEMSGVILFIFALLHYIQEYYPDAAVRLGERAPGRHAVASQNRLDRLAVVDVQTFAAGDFQTARIDA